MIRNILKQLWNRRDSNIWICIELLLVSIFLWILIHQFLLHCRSFNRPMGFDITNTYLIQLSEQSRTSDKYITPEESGSNREEDLINILARIRLVEGVEELSVSSCARPYCPCNSSAPVSAIHGKDTLTFFPYIRWVSPEYFRVFRIKKADGQTIAGQSQKLPYFVLSQNLADSLKISFNDSVSQGYPRKYPVEVCTDIRYAETWPDIFNAYSVTSERNLIGAKDICIRLKDGLTAQQQQTIWEKISAACRVNNFFLFYKEPYDKIRKEYISTLTDELKAEAWYAVFLIINMLMGIVGTFWLQTQQRRTEIGIRIVAGATKKSLFAQFIGEGILLLSSIFLLTIVIQLNLWHLEIISVDNWQSFVCDMLATWIVLAMTIILGIWYPARQAMKVNPADVLHEE